MSVSAQTPLPLLPPGGAGSCYVILACGKAAAAAGVGASITCELRFTGVPTETGSNGGRVVEFEEEAPLEDVDGTADDLLWKPCSCCAIDVVQISLDSDEICQT